MKGVLLLHIAAIAFWIGVVGAEFVIERSRADNKPHGFAVAHNHFWIDVCLEIPVVLLVLATGLLLLRDTPMTPLLAVKVAAGGFAAVANLVCIVPVTRRRRAAMKDALAEVIRQSKVIDRISALAIPASAVAMLIGLYLLASS